MLNGDFSSSREFIMMLQPSQRRVSISLAQLRYIIPSQLMPVQWLRRACLSARRTRGITFDCDKMLLARSMEMARDAFLSDVVEMVRYESLVRADLVRGLFEAERSK